MPVFPCLRSFEEPSHEPFHITGLKRGSAPDLRNRMKWKGYCNMALYEHVFLVRQDASASQVEALTEQFKTIIGDNGGSVGKTEYWGLRSLPYRMKKNRKAHYSLMNIDAPHPAVAEMERQMQINEDVIRHMTLRVEEHEEEPSAMMRSRGGRERDDRKPGFGNRDDRPGTRSRPR